MKQGAAVAELVIDTMRFIVSTGGEIVYNLHFEMI